MGYSDHDDVRPARSEKPWTTFDRIAALAARLAGLAFLSIGLWAAGSVIFEAWSLYEDPLRIERFASAIETGSNLDRLFTAEWPRAPRNTAPLAGYDTSAAEGPVAPSGPRAQPGQDKEKNLRLSYFAAWFIVPLLLWVIGSLAMHAINVGGRLALSETHSRGVSRAIVEEMRRLRRAA